MAVSPEAQARIEKRKAHEAKYKEAAALVAKVGKKNSLKLKKTDPEHHASVYKNETGRGYHATYPANPDAPFSEYNRVRTINAKDKAAMVATVTMMLEDGFTSDGYKKPGTAE